MRRFEETPAHPLYMEELLILPFQGEICALMAPMTWSLAIILFRKSGEVVPPVALNLFKNTVAILLSVITLLLFRGGLLLDYQTSDYVLLLVSGAIGIGVSDTLFFMALNRVGAGLWSIINTSYSPSIILLSMIFLGERLTPLQLAGVAAIVSAVLAVAWMRGGPKSPVSKKVLVQGIILGILAMLSQGVSIVMVKPLLNDAPLLWANVWRLFGGGLAMFLLMPLLPRWKQQLASLKNPRGLVVMVPGAVLGSYVSLLFWLCGMKFTQASVASALNQTATLFTFVLAALLLKEPVTWRRILGLVIGMGGVALVTFGG